MTAVHDSAPSHPAASDDSHRSILRVAFQGELGAYGDQAITQHWGGKAAAVPSASFEHVVTEVAWGLVQYGILPVWNTVVGDISPGRDAIRLARSSPYDLIVVGDAHVVVRHQLLACSGVEFDEIDRVESHPVALAQCQRFFSAHPRIAPHEVYDTAGAARKLANRGPRTSAAIAGHAAAQRYGLSIIAADIQDVPDNVTQFFVLARRHSSSIELAAAHALELLRW